MADPRRKATSAISIGYQEFLNVARDAEAIKKHVQGLKQTYLKWSPSEGGTFSKRAADDFKNELIGSIKDQSAFENALPLTDMWIRKKKRLKLDPRIGIATGQMINNIKSIDMGHGTWRVGIPGTVKVKDEDRRAMGKIETVWEYAHILEHGWKRQPPRPFIGPAFLRWVEERFPELMEDTVIKDMEKYLDKLSKLARVFTEEK